MAHSDSWRATLTRLGWTDSYLAGPAFDQFLDAERVRVGRIVSRLRGSAARRTRRGPAMAVPRRWSSAASALTIDAALRQTPGTPRDHRANNAPVVRIALGLVSFVALLNLAGFVAAGTVLFACTASAFGSRRWLRDALVGLTLCATVYVTFTYGLGRRAAPRILRSTVRTER